MSWLLINLATTVELDVIQFDGGSQINHHIVKLL